MAELTEVATDTVVEVGAEALHYPKSVIGVVVGIGIGAGFTAGYLFAKRQLETKYNQIAEEEIADIRAHYHAKDIAAKPELDEVMEELGYKSRDAIIKKENQKIIGTGEEADPEKIEYVQATAARIAQAAKATDEARKRDQRLAEKEAAGDVKDPVQSLKNVFAENKKNEPTTDVWDYAIETKNRKGDAPYVIHVDEYNDESHSYDHYMLTYYEDDDVLADEKDGVIEDQDAMVGLANLSKFGHGSNDVNIVYVRNDEKEMDIEVVRSAGSYAEEVHGLKHSDMPRRRPRDWDG